MKRILKQLVINNAFVFRNSSIKDCDSSATEAVFQNNRISRVIKGHLIYTSQVEIFHLFPI